jgi:hypothetical protein
MQSPGESEWTVLESGADIIVTETYRLIADAVEGAEFSVGDGSLLDMSPGAIIEIKNPRTLPRLQVTLREGTLLFTAQEPSYELFTSACPVSLLSIPSTIEIEVNGETTRLAIEEGAATCALEEKTLTLPMCRELLLRPDEEPEVSVFCTASTPTPPPVMTISPSSTPWWSDSTQTLTATTSIPTPTTTPTPTLVPPTALPTDTPTSPPPPTSRPRPEPTKPPPTEPPPPPPTEPPPPPPTEPPPTEPPPTEPPPPPNTPRPTEVPSRPTSTPSS